METDNIRKHKIIKLYKYYNCSKSRKSICHSTKIFYSYQKLQCNLMHHNNKMIVLVLIVSEIKSIETRKLRETFITTYFYFSIILISKNHINGNCVILKKKNTKLNDHQLSFFPIKNFEFVYICLYNRLRNETSIYENSTC